MWLRPQCRAGSGPPSSSSQLPALGGEELGQARGAPHPGLLPHAAPGQGGQKHKQSPALQSSADQLNRWDISLLGVLWERGWKTVGTKQGLTPNSRVNTLKNRPGGSCLPLQGWEDPPLPGLGRWFPSLRRGQAKHTRRRPNQQAHGTVLRRRSKQPPERCQHGRNSTGAVGCWGRGAARLPQGCFPRDGAWDSQVCTHPMAGHPSISQLALLGWFNMDRKRETGRGQPILPPGLLWHRQGLKCIEAKAESED